MGVRRVKRHVAEVIGSWFGAASARIATSCAG
jgi:hypothetical protein